MTDTVSLSSAAIVGALACQKDSYLRSLETKVVSCMEYVPPKSMLANTKSKAKRAVGTAKSLKNGAPTSEKEYLIEFADSVLFPEGTCSLPTWWLSG